MKLQIKTGLIVLALLLTSLTAGAQTVSGKWTGQSVKTVLKEIETQTGLSIFYRTDEVDENALVTGEFNNAPVEKALQSILGKDVAVTLNGKMIVLSKEDRTGVKGIKNRKTGVSKWASCISDMVLWGVLRQQMHLWCVITILRKARTP